MSRRAPLALVLGAVPWSWYLVRNLSSRMDAIALLWPVIAVGAVLVLVAAAVLAKRPELLVAIASWIVAFAVVVVMPWRPLGGPTPSSPMKIVAANTYGGNHRPPAEIARALLRQRPDVLVVSELTPALDRQLRDQLPWVVTSASATGIALGSDVGVYSRYPVERTNLPADLTDQRGARVVVHGPGRPLVLYALHLQKPGASTNQVEVGFRTYSRLVTRVVAAVRHETGPVVVAGDLNLSDRTSGYRALTGVLDDAMRSGWTGPTTFRLTTRFLLARIDHILMTEHWCRAGSHTFSIPGSDHRGVATSVGPCPPG